ncbi:MAG: DsbA family protein [Vulcanococcus sp.]|uniref:DsbA family protein n=1 Tax=Vulcanococcus sp. TaxID=2856995 RepID=UPI0025FAAA9B|nr:DsbA family protein [Vulcanococcus sp.]MBW0167514.1 DsbA family protein [Vulcanococcus sp.]
MALALDSSGSNPWLRTHARCAIHSETTQRSKHLSPSAKKPTTATIGIKGDPVMGSPSAPVTIVQFSDFECPYCKRFHEETLPKLKQHYIDKGLVRFIHKDLPLPFHQNAHLAATTARCAQEDGKYWEAYQALFSQQNCLNCKGPIAITATTGINRNKLEQCNQDNRIKQAVDINISEAELNGIRATPTFVIGRSNRSMQNGKIIEGAIPWTEFKLAVDRALSEAKKGN